MRRSVILAFACIYFVWGSTYLAIRMSLESFPAFSMGSVRFFLAGAILWLVMKTRGARPLTPEQLRLAAVTGILLTGCGNGLVVLAQKRIDSGVASLWVATVPLWFLLFNFFFFDRARPSLRSWVGSFVGLAGVGTLALSEDSSVRGEDWPYVVALVSASLSWTIGSLLSRKGSDRRDPLVFSAYQMIFGSMFLAVLGWLHGDWASFAHGPITGRAVAAMLYLMIFGSVLAYTTYVWLLGQVEPQLVATYALVNPLVALFLGIVFADESVGPRTWVAAALVITGVGLVIFGGKRRPVVTS